ncbi:MAG TPA: indole-3-glycerol phosphate synthase TrpC [Thermoanaerobaculia bacterium]|nr:indole-3-glycerol phosphate synthase TrpC [Thermoanaerobaculia bacterium]
MQPEAGRDILSRIVASTRLELASVESDRELFEQTAREVAALGEPHAFSRAIRRIGGEPIRIIAEVKSASPSAGVIVDGPEVENIATAYRDGGAAAVSVVTEPVFFKGSRDWLQRARSSSLLPVIMKDFIVDPLQIHRGVAAGADAVLLLASLLDASSLHAMIDLLDRLGRDALVEVHDEEELDRAIEAGARIIGVNNRNLRDFVVDLGTSERLSAKIPESVIRVAESGIRTRQDAQRLERVGFDAILVGESLLRQADRTAAVRSLRGEA